eukprot:364132-Chlamydomonas_euryale.AAC.8
MGCPPRFPHGFPQDFPQDFPQACATGLPTGLLPGPPANSFGAASCAPTGSAPHLKPQWVARAAADHKQLTGRWHAQCPHVGGAARQAQRHTLQRGAVQDTLSTRTDGCGCKRP